MGPLRTLIRELLKPTAPTIAAAGGGTVATADDATATTTQPAADPVSWQVRYAPLIRKVLAWGLAALLGAVATRLGLPPEAVPVPVPMSDPLDAVPFNYEGAAYHGDGPEHVESNGRPWPTKKLTWYVDYDSAAGLRPALSKDAISGAFRQAWGWWAEGLDIEPVEVSDPAQALVRIKFDRMDGPSGVLAESYLADGTLTPKTQRYDVSERWTPGPPANGLLSLPTVACHEIGHVLGLSHDDPTAPAVMRPMYTAAIPREQARDYARLVALGYRKREKAPAGPVDVLSFPVQARTQDVIDALEKAGFKVAK